MIEWDVQIVGDRKVAARFDGMSERLRERLRDLFPQVGEEIRAAAASLAPHSPRRSSASRRLGPLHSKIKATYSERLDTFIETVSAGTAFYGAFQERGLNTMRQPPRKRGIVGVQLRHLKSGGVATSPRRGLVRPQGGVAKSFHLPAHPFLGPAFQSRRESILARIRDAVGVATT